MTPAEIILWEHLRRRSCGGYNFRRQQVLLGFVVDFYCHEGRLAIELDGSIHDLQQQHDVERTKVLVDNGFSLIRFKNDDVYSHLDAVLKEIIDKLT
jgi:very-short-patch-repair endonuclease